MGSDWRFAMHLYGSSHLTKDVDVIATAVLNPDSDKNFVFGGKRCPVRFENIEVPADWIVRTDTARKFYERALQNAHKLPGGLLIVIPEWLVILNYIAGRFKDSKTRSFY